MALQLRETKVLLTKASGRAELLPGQLHRSGWRRGRCARLPESRCPGLTWQFDGAAGCGRGGKSNVKMK